MEEIKGIRAYSRKERMAVVDQLIPPWKKKFGDNLLGIVIGASVARGEDQAYSDLELDIFLREKPEKREDQYLQRVVDGMLIEAIYHTPEEFLKERETIPQHWYLSASDRWMVVYGQEFFEDLLNKMKGIQHSKEDMLAAASRNRFELQESFGKVLNAVEMKNHEGISLLLMDVVLHLLQILSFVNQQPFTTFSQFISEAREFQIKPERFDDLLDLLVNGTYQELEEVKEICMVVFGSLEENFKQLGIELYNDELDPNLPNRTMIHPIGSEN
ncbi:MAG: hypothetical protein K0B14_17300 [Anaerolineaceae bacterium]|nr:hypothetical protein [Anaerolineaceae bacterium]